MSCVTQHQEKTPNVYCVQMDTQTIKNGHNYARKKYLIALITIHVLKGKIASLSRALMISPAIKIPSITREKRPDYANNHPSFVCIY